MSVAVFGSNQSMRISSGFLNSVDDAAPGTTITSPSGSISPAYPGQVGGKLTLDVSEALKKSLTTTATLYDGLYMYVKFKAGSTAAPARGQIVFWDDPTNYVVTPDAVAANIMFPAGIVLNAVTKGNYGFIQVLGKASVLFKGTITKGAPAIGDMVVVDGAPGNGGDVLADATGLTSLTARLAIGTAIEAPVGGQVKLVRLGYVLNNMVF